jgi:hypothetical protein
MLQNKYAFADLKKGADGVYTDANGNPMGIAVDFALQEWLGGNTLKDYVESYGAQYFNLEKWDALVALADANGIAPLTDESYGYLVSVISTTAWGETADDAFNYFAEGYAYADNYDFANVGIMKTGEYEITIVLGKSLAGFNLLYNLSGNWIVYEDLYESCKKQIEGTDAWTTTYNTSKETTMSYGPYLLTKFQPGKQIVLFAIVAQQEPGQKYEKAGQGHIISNRFFVTNEQRNAECTQNCNNLLRFAVCIK